MEIIVSFKKIDYSTDGTHLASDKFVMELQREWEGLFYNQFAPYYANMISGHPSAMNRLCQYMGMGTSENYEFGMELIEGEIDLDTNLAIETYREPETVYAIGSQLHDDEDNPLWLIRNENLSPEILVISYYDDDDGENETEYLPVEPEVEVKFK